MTVKDRVLIVLRGAEQPLASHQIARILGLPTPSITSPINRLHAYGKIDMVGHGLHPRRRLYRVR